MKLNFSECFFFSLRLKIASARAGGCRLLAEQTRRAAMDDGRRTARFGLRKLHNVDST